VAARTYAETLPSGRKETHHENVERVVAMHVKRFPRHEDMIRDAFKYVHAKIVLPSMRGFQFSGKAIERSHARIFNCFYVNVTSFKDVADALWLSMNGGGVGYSVQHHHIKGLPRITGGDANLQFQITDDKEGWADSIHTLLMNPSVRFDYSLIRPENSLLSTGGTASGPKPLRDAHQHIRAILKRACGRQLTSLEVHDIMCHQADAVVVGGVRRAALICLFDPDDTEMLTCKSGDWWEKQPQRARANNSAVLRRTDPYLKDLIRSMMEQTFNSASGEPGLFISSDPDGHMGTNPCQPARATVLMPEGIRTMGDVKVGSTIWSGMRWTRVSAKMATGIKPVFEYRTRAGVVISTENHRIVQNGEKIEVSQAEAVDRCPGPTAYNQTLNPQDVVDGFVLGDGMVHRASNDLVLACVGENDGSVLSDKAIGKFFTKERPALNQCAWEVTTTITAAELPRTYERHVPARFKHGEIGKICGFLRGLFTANGSVSGNRVVLKATSFAVIDDVQQMLSAVGIASYYTVNKSRDVEFANGTYTCKESYDLNVTTDRRKFSALIGFVQPYKTAKIRETQATRRPSKVAYEIVDVISAGEEEVFDITVEADEHTYWSGGLLVSNCGEIALPSRGACNLSEVNVAACRTVEEFINATRAATLIGTLQATYTDFRYIHPDWRANCEREALLGVSITGQAENWGLISDPEVLRAGAAAMLTENARVAGLLGINPAARIGCTKPSGSASTYVGTTPGIHAAYDAHFLRRVMVEKSSPLASYLIGKFGCRDPNGGGIIEHSLHKESVIAVAAPHEAVNAILSPNESAIQLLERARHIKEHWIIPSHRAGANYHNVSLTVSYRPDEQAGIIDWVQRHAGATSGVSFFPRDGGTHQNLQMPYESITQEQFGEWTKKYDGVKVDLSEIDFRGHADERLGEAACAGGACLI